MDNILQEPIKLKNCVKNLVADPNFKASLGKTKEESAWNVCQASLAKAMDNIAEAVVILKHFEEESIEKDYSTVSSDDLNPNGDPLQPEVVGVDDVNSIDTTTPDTSSLASDFLSNEINHAADPFQSVNLNVEGSSSSDLENIDNLKGNPLL